MKVREVIRLLEKHRWVEMRSKGSHRHFKHPNQALVVTVPGSEGKELAPGFLNAILEKAGLSETLSSRHRANSYRIFRLFAGCRWMRGGRRHP
jgi:predicted RNA binding protein YcfA (HicA-like mRNA interferase family)